MPPNNAVPAKTPELKIDLKATTVYIVSLRFIMRLLHVIGGLKLKIDDMYQVAGIHVDAKLLLGDGVEIAAFS